MKTIDNNRSNPSEIKLGQETFNNTLELINNTIKNNDWLISGDLQKLPELMLDYINSDISLSRRKELKKRIYFLYKKVTINRINNVLRSINNNTIKIEKSAHEQNIIKSRKEYVELRNKANVALLNYKSIKGDYYK